MRLLLGGLALLAGCSAPPAAQVHALPAATATPDVVAPGAAKTPVDDAAAPAAPLASASAVTAPVATAPVPAAASPTAAMVPAASVCPGSPRHWFFEDGSDLFAKVQKGWSTAKVLALLGGPRSCDNGTWVYVAGQLSGPEVTYEFTVKKGVVTKIEQYGVGCRMLQ